MARNRSLTRRDLFKAGAAAGLSIGFPGALLARIAGSPDETRSSKGRAGFISVSSANGLRSTARAVELMREGVDTLDAAISGVNIVEDDPNDTSVGYGGLPNERGVVELDSCVMHGPTYRAGAVASLQNIKRPSSVAKLVMDRTDHILLVGPGALEFARLMGFEEENLLTERARQAWLRWKSGLNPGDNWLDDDQVIGGHAARGPDEPAPTGTITCLAMNDKAEVSGVTTTSGLAWKIPGRVGDSPIIGAGLYVDNEVGAAGSTGRGEAAILESGSRIVVENMRRGLKPQEACLDVLERICRRTVEPRLIHSPGRPRFNLNFYALNKDGEIGGAAIYRGGRYAAFDGATNSIRNSAFIHESPG